MAHGTPDWGLIGPKQTTYGLDDLGEHAARLGSIVSWDRRGDVIMLDDFEHGLSQASYGALGAGANLALVCGHSRSNAFSVEMTPGSTALQRARVEYRRGTPAYSRLGLEYAFATHTNTEYWYWSLTRRTWTHRQQAVVRYDHVNKRLEYLDVLNVYQPFATAIDLFEIDFPAHVGKMVADFTLGEYVRVILNEVTYSLHGIGLYTFADLTGARLWVGIDHISAPGKVATGYLDSVILTQNEP